MSQINKEKYGYCSQSYFMIYKEENVNKYSSVKLREDLKVLGENEEFKTLLHSLVKGRKKADENKRISFPEIKKKNDL